MALDQAIVGFFRKKGYTDEQARGIAAGISAESANDHTAFNREGGGKGAVGLGQWRGERQRKLRDRFGPKPTKTQQLEFLHSELQGGDHGGKKVLAKSSAVDVLRSYIDDFMRPAKGAETTGDLRRGRAALGLKGGDPTSRSSGSTYDRVQASRQTNTGPSIQNVYDAYRAGKMDPRDAAQFENDVLSGHVMLPRNAKLKRTPSAPTLPAGVVAAYNSREMSDEDRAQVDNDLRDGLFALPRGVKLQAPAPRGFLENINLGLTSIRRGLDDPIDMLAAPVNTAVNAVLGTNLSTSPLNDQTDREVEMMGGPKPESDAERLMDSGIRAATPGVLTGIGGPAAMLTDVASGFTSGISSEYARQSGAGLVGQTVAGLAGGTPPIAAALGAERSLARAGRRAGRPATEIVADTPREVLLDDTGKLTDDGAEFAAQNGITPEELRAAYAPPDIVPANDTGANVSARAVNDDLPIERVESAPPVRAISEEAAPAPAAAAETPAQPEPLPDTPIADTPLPADAKARVAQAEEFGIPLSRGDATQDFAVQDAENTLRAAASGEGEKARTFRVKQQEAISDAVTQLRSAFGDVTDGATDRGAVVKEALRGLRDQGKAGVTKLYQEAAALGGDNLGLITDDIKRAAQDVQINEAVDPIIKRTVDQELARYGLVGKAEPMNEVGITKVVLDDGSSVSFRGQAEPLTVANAENLRQTLNKLFLKDDTNSLGSVKVAIDDAVEEALEAAAARGDKAGPVADAYQNARAAHKEQKATFNSKDVVQSLIDWKKGTQTDLVAPEKAIAQIFAGGKEGVTNLKKIKALLLSKPTEASKAAWQAIKAQGVGDVFGQAYTVNSNLGNGSIGSVSGAKLNSAIANFGADKLKILLDASEFNNLMKLRRVIGDVTIPISGTTNPSGSAFKIMKFLTPITARFSGIPLAGPVVDTVAGLVQKGREVAQAQKTLTGMTEYTAKEAAAETVKNSDVQSAVVRQADEAANALIKSFIDIAGSGRLLAPILTSGPSEDREK